MSGVKGLPAFVDRWPERWRARFDELYRAALIRRASPQRAAEEAERKVRGEYFTHELAAMRDRLGVVPERPGPRRDPRRMTHTDRTAPKD